MMKNCWSKVFAIFVFGLTMAAYAPAPIHRDDAPPPRVMHSQAHIKEEIATAKTDRSITAMPSPERPVADLEVAVRGMENTRVDDPSDVEAMQQVSSAVERDRAPKRLPLWPFGLFAVLIGAFFAFRAWADKVVPEPTARRRMF